MVFSCLVFLLKFFRNRPEMISLSKFHGEFSLPPIRSSFLKQFCELKPSANCSTLQYLSNLQSSVFCNFTPFFEEVASKTVSNINFLSFCSF